MPILKKLIIKEWLKSSLGAIFVLILLVSVANIISELLREVTTLNNILKHNLLELPKWLNKIFPVACLTGSLFSLNKLQNRSELIAIFVCGFSRKAFIFLIFQLSFLFAAFQMVNNAYIIPLSKTLQWVWIKEDAIHFRDNQEKSIKTTFFADGKIWYKGEDYFSSFSAFDKGKSELRELTLFFYHPENYLTRIIKADTAKYQDNHVWKLENGTIYQHLSKQSAFPQIKPFTESTMELRETPSDFSRIDADIGELNIKKLHEYIKTMEKLGINVHEYRVMFYDQFSSSVICILFALVSLSAIFRPNRRGRSFGKNVFFILIFNIIYWPSYYTSMAMGSSGQIPPLLATFALPLICTLYLILFFLKHRNVS